MIHQGGLPTRHMEGNGGPASRRGGKECGRGMPRPYELAGWKTRPNLSRLREKGQVVWKGTS